MSYYAGISCHQSNRDGYRSYPVRVSTYVERINSGHWAIVFIIIGERLVY